MAGCVGGPLVLAVLAAMSGADGVTTRTASETVGDHSDGTATARCKSGTKAISGGFEGEFDATKVIAGQSPLLQLHESQRRGNRWTGSAYNLGAAGDLTTFVYCSPQKLRSRSKSTSIEGSPFMSGDLATGTATAKCPRGTTAVSGGFDNPDFKVEGDFSHDRRVVPFISRKLGGRKWTVEGANQAGAEATLVAYAYCQDAPSLRTKRKSVTFAAPLNGVGVSDAVAKCAKGQRVLSGGFKLTGLEPILLASKRVGGRAWKASASVGYPGEAELTAFAYCKRKR